MRFGKVKINQEILSVAIFFSSFLNIICIGKISNLQITIQFILCILYFVVSIIGLSLGSIHISKKRFLIFSIMLLSFFVSTVSNPFGANFSSLTLYAFYFSLFVFTNTKNNDVDIIPIMTIFIKLTFVAALFGIYQFFAYNFMTRLPFKELIPEFLWVSNMNTITYTHSTAFAGIGLIRAHSIFSEPSIFSQFCAVAILFSLIQKQIEKGKKYLIIVVCSIGMIVSLSGSGFIVLAFGLLSFFRQGNNKQRLLLLSAIGCTMALFFMVDNNSFFSYLSGRSKELFTRGGYSSGYYRFILPFEISVSRFFGYGIGNDDYAMELFNALEKNVSNGFGKIAIELGVVGIIEIILFFLCLYPNKRTRNRDEAIILFWITLSMNIVGTFMMPFFWGFALLLCKINNNKGLVRSSIDYEYNNSIKLQ